MAINEDQEYKTLLEKYDKGTCENCAFNGIGSQQCRRCKRRKWATDNYQVDIALLRPDHTTRYDK